MKAQDETDWDLFKEWRAVIAPIEKLHFTDSSTEDLAGSYSSPCEYRAQPEDYIRSETYDDLTYVLVDDKNYPLTRHHEYTVRNHNKKFKIEQIAVHYQDPAQPFLDSKEITELQDKCAISAPLLDVNETETTLDHNRNFTVRKVIFKGGESTQTEISYIGDLVTSSGVLTVWDFGWDNDNAIPLGRSVTPGTYPVDRVTAFDRNAAIRVKFSDHEPTSWRVALHTGANIDSGVGVDHGCICIADFAAYGAITPRQKNCIYDSYNESELPSAQQFPIDEKNTGIACDSGWGDGCYAMFWGLDTAGEIAQLVVDFSVLVTRDDDHQLRYL